MPTEPELLPRTHRNALPPWLATAAAACIILALYIRIGCAYIEPYVHGVEHHYSSLAEGMLSGHLSLSIKPPAELLNLPNPYDPEQNGRYALHDASLYQGRYYLYFGPAPALLLFLPYEAITGQPLSQQTAAVVFCFVAFLAGALILLRIRSLWLRQTSWFALFASTLVWGLVNWSPVLLRRAAVWEVAIAAGSMAMMLGSLCLFLQITSKRPLLWTALASLCFGVMFASRALTLFASASLLFPMLSELRKRSIPWRQFWAACLPLGTFIAAIFAYNYVRFGKWTEFGITYILSAMNISKQAMFGWTYIPVNAYMVLWAPARLSPYFPFVKLADIPPLPAGHDSIRTGIEEMNGALTNMPVLFLAAAAGFVALQAGSKRAEVRTWIAANAWMAGSVCAVIVCFLGVCSRYLSDFVPPLALLAAVGCMGASSWTFRGSSVAKGLVAALAVASCGFVLGQSAEHGEIFRAMEPQLYGRIAHALNTPSALYARIAGVPYGPRDLTVIFPQARTGHAEPLLSTGVGPRTDTVVVRYESDHSIKIGMQWYHTVYAWSQPLELDYSKPHLVHIEMGSLYPPSDHPYFDALAPADRTRLQRTARVSVDGHVMINGQVEFSDAVGFEPTIGSTRAWAQSGWFFSGTVLGVASSSPAAAR